MVTLNGRRSLRVFTLMLLLAWLLGPNICLAQDASAAVDSPALRAFEHLKSLAGDWQSNSTKGWAGNLHFEVIAGGSVVLVISEVDPHAGTKMATAFHLDGESLVLTHYCVAGNQPNLEATEISNDGREMLFTFRGGGNLTSRDQGHMDKAHIVIADTDHYTSRWTWYQDGEERWMEDIVNVRQP